MKTLLRAALLLALSSKIAWAIPQDFSGGNVIGPVIPAMPQFNGNLTEGFLDEKNWESGKLPGPWREISSRAGQEASMMTANPTLFGAVPQNVRAYRESGKLMEVVIHYLDAGTFFGFDLDGEQTSEDKAAGDKKRAEFKAHYSRLADALRGRLQRGCGRVTQNVVGRSAELRCAFLDYSWQGFRLRLALRDQFSIVLHLLRQDNVTNTKMAPSVEKLSVKERKELLQRNVTETPRGDTIIKGLPSLQQGRTPFCGIHALAMLAQYHGLRIDPEDLAAAAEFKKNGTAKGSDMLDVYRAVGTELGMRFQIGKNFDRATIAKLVGEGMPVVVWRRVTKARDDAHTANSAKIAADPTAKLPFLKDEQLEYPDKENRSLLTHASVISGFNLKEGEVIFSEPWGDNARERRMRIEEMESSVYAVFIYRL